MTVYYHGTDRDLATGLLVAGSYVTRHYKDAEKFGYRKAVSNGQDTVRIYTVDVDPAQTRPDPKRDRAFVILNDARVVLLSEMPTFVVPHKLGKFKLGLPP